MGRRCPAISPAYSDVWVGDAFDRMPVWIGCGSSDPFYENSRRLAEMLPGARTDWADGGHDQCLWRLVAPRQMTFAVSALRG